MILNTRTHIRCGTLLALLCGLTGLVQATQREEIRGLEAARAWLELVDAGKYRESWEATAPDFRAQIDVGNWIRLLEEHRRPLGKPESRILKRLFFSTELPDAPSGFYVVVQFETRFPGQDESLRETITPVLVETPLEGVEIQPSDIPPGDWRVTGYYVQ